MTTKYARFGFLWVACLLSCPSACTSPGGATLGEVVSDVLVGSRPPPRIVSDPAQRVAARRVAAYPIAGARLSPGRFAMGGPGQGVVTDDDGRALLSLLVACALPPEVTLVAPVGGTPVEFSGVVGLAPRWVHESLDRPGREWVSACVMSELSGTALAVPVSIRAPRPELDASRDERDAWSLEEGAFFGDVFVDPGAPLPWFACRGVGAAGDVALEDRVCAEPDVDHPTVTECGMAFAGSCSSACERRRGVYTACRSGAFETRRVVTAFLIP